MNTRGRSPFLHHGEHTRRGGVPLPQPRPPHAWERERGRGGGVDWQRRRWRRHLSTPGRPFLVAAIATSREKKGNQDWGRKREIYGVRPSSGDGDEEPPGDAPQVPANHLTRGWARTGCRQGANRSELSQTPSVFGAYKVSF